MNNKMADDYMDGLVKEIQSLQAENDRLRKVEEKAKEFVSFFESLYVFNSRVAKTKPLHDKYVALKDALKGGINENRTNKTD